MAILARKKKLSSGTSMSGFSDSWTAQAGAGAIAEPSKVRLEQPDFKFSVHGNFRVKRGKHPMSSLFKTRR